MEAESQTGRGGRGDARRRIAWRGKAALGRAGTPVRRCPDLSFEFESHIMTTGFKPLAGPV
jgi:hypothetical protein